jgi:hypothetical protein
MFARSTAPCRSSTICRAGTSTSWMIGLSPPCCCCRAIAAAAPAACPAIMYCVSRRKALNATRLADTHTGTSRFVQSDLRGIRLSNGISNTQ